MQLRYTAAHNLSAHHAMFKSAILASTIAYAAANISLSRTVSDATRQLPQCAPGDAPAVAGMMDGAPMRLSPALLMFLVLPEPPPRRAGEPGRTGHHRERYVFHRLHEHRQVGCPPHRWEESQSSRRVAQFYAVMLTHPYIAPSFFLMRRRYGSNDCTFNWGETVSLKYAVQTKNQLTAVRYPGQCARFAPAVDASANPSPLARRSSRPTR